MVDLADLARGEADLVAVGAVARSSAERNLLLRQLARQRLAERAARVGSTRHAHGLIDVRTARERIADSAAEARRRAAERLDLRRMVVRLVLEHDEPVFLLAADVGLDDDAAGVDFLGLVEVIEQAFLAQRLGADDGDVHERDRAVCILAVERVSVFLVLAVSCRQCRREVAVLDRDIVDGRRERRVAAVIRPVRVDDAQLRDRRRAVFRVAEVLLAELEVLKAHGKAARIHERMELVFAHRVERSQHLDIGRLFRDHVERLRLFKRRLAALDGIDAVILDLLQRLVIDCSRQHDDACRGDLRTLLLRDELDALRRRVCRLVVLARQVLDGKHAGILECWQRLFIDFVNRCFRKDDKLDLLVLLIAEALDVVAVDDADRLEAIEMERLLQIVAELLSRDVESLSFFYENSSYRHECFFLQTQNRSGTLRPRIATSRMGPLLRFIVPKVNGHCKKAS